MANETVAELVGELNSAFAEFKAHHNEKVDKLNLEVERLHREVDEAHLKIGAAELDGSNRVTAEGGDKPIGMRTVGDFRAHYGANRGDEVKLSDFMRGVAGMKTSEAAIKALSEGTDTAGGYSVPNIVMPGILGAMVPASSLLQAGAGFVPLDRGAKTATTAVMDTLPSAAWRAELGVIAESDPTFRAVVATPRSLACIVRVSRELLADSPDMDRALRLAIGQAFAKEIDRVGLRGSGTAPEPRGLLNTVGVNTVDFGGANGAAPLDFAPILSGIEPILTSNGPMPTAAIMATRTLLDFNSLADTTNQPLEKPSLVQPVRFLHTSQIPINLTVGTSTDCSEIYLGDFTQMHFLLREKLSVGLLREAYSATGEIGFLCHARLDVVVPYPAAFTVIKGIR